jgi:hypothetical protein
MKELELELQKLKEAIELRDPYLQIEAIGNLGLALIELSNELGHNYDNCVNNALEDLK